MSRDDRSDDYAMTAPVTKPVSAPLLQILDLHFAHAGQEPLAAGWSAALGPGLGWLHGDTGSGKTSLLQVLAGRLPARGRLALDGVRLDQDPAGYGRKLFYIDPSTSEFDPLGVAACTDALRAGDPGFDEAAWQALADGFALAPHLGKAMYMLSTGSKRKVWLAAALASSRPLLLFDEPTAALDAASIRCFWRALEEKARRPTQAVLVASYELADESPIASRIVSRIELPLPRPGA